MTGKHTKFLWTDQCNQAFEKLKEVLSSSPILGFPTVDDEFLLDTDASNHKIGAVLSQIQNGIKRVIGYFSKVLDKSQMNYCIVNR